MLSKADYDLLVLYREPRPWPETEEDEKRFRLLLDRKLVDAVSFQASSGDGWFSFDATHYEVTPAGKDALLEYEKNEAQRRKKETTDAAEKKSERRFQTRLVLLTVALTVAGTLLVEHFKGIVEFFRGLLG